MFLKVLGNGDAVGLSRQDVSLFGSQRDADSCRVCCLTACCSGKNTSLNTYANVALAADVQLNLFKLIIYYIWFACRVVSINIMLL